MKPSPQLANVLITFVAATLVANAPLRAQSAPDMRPALVGNGPKSLINLIDPKHVMQRGVQHGALFFYAVVAPNGFPTYSKVWGNTKEIQPLREELRNKLALARFIPAIYNHRNVYAAFYGTLAFSTTDGKPHVRICANQEPSEQQ